MKNFWCLWAGLMAIAFWGGCGDGGRDIGIGVGGEYFLGDKFSVGVEAQLNATHSSKTSSRFGNPGGWNINTASAVLATVYF